MPIQTIEERNSLPIIGTIRLGIKKESKSGSLYPSTVEHFVLEDAPGVEEAYGPNPTSLDIVFANDNLEEVLPTWLKWYSQAVQGKDGSVIGGKLNCVGNGPDGNGNPGLARHYAARDAVTHVVPTRPCLGEACKDWKNSRGDQQCRQQMTVIAMLPLVSWYGAFKITTTSWNSIRGFHSQLKLVQSLNGGIIKGIPFKIVREETATKFFDKDGKEKTGKQYIMQLRPNEKFFLERGEDVQKKLAVFKSTTFSLGPTKQQELLEAPSEHVFAEAQGAASTEDPKSKADELLKDPEVNQKFDQLQALTGRVFNEKGRLIAIRKKESEPDVKTAVLQELDRLIGVEKGKRSETPAMDAGGIM